MTLQDGELNRRIHFERKESVRDPLGGEGEPRWVRVSSVWAKRTNNLAATSEVVAAGAERYREQVRYDIRPRAVDPTWRIVEDGADGKAFDIKSAALSNDRSELAIIAISGVSDG